MTVWTVIGVCLGGCALFGGWLFGKWMDGLERELRRVERRLAALDREYTEPRTFGFSYLRDDGDELAREAAIGLLAWLVDDEPVRRG